MIHVYNEISKGKRERFDFNDFGSLNLVFVGYSIEEKTDRQRMWRRVAWWDNYNLRDCTIKTAPTLTDEVKEQAKAQVIELIRVMTFPEWKSR